MERAFIHAVTRLDAVGDLRQLHTPVPELGLEIIPIAPGHIPAAWPGASIVEDKRPAIRDESGSADNGNTGWDMEGLVAADVVHMARSANAPVVKFWLSSTEVTQAQYREIMGENPSKYIGDDMPVQMISWHDATEFCRTLTKRERRAGRLPAGQVYRLPTSDEWEYACRAGWGTTFFFGNNPEDLDKYAWYREANGGRDVPNAVGGKRPNACGLYDLYGNVWEWCLESKSAGTRGRAHPPAVSPRKPPQTMPIRGGCWRSGATRCASAVVARMAPTEKVGIVGFRLARGAPVVE